MSEIYEPLAIDTIAETHIIEETVVNIVRRRILGACGNFSKCFVVIDYCNTIIFEGTFYECRDFARGKLKVGGN